MLDNQSVFQKAPVKTATFGTTCSSLNYLWYTVLTQLVCNADKHSTISIKWNVPDTICPIKWSNYGPILHLSILNTSLLRKLQMCLSSSKTFQKPVFYMFPTILDCYSVSSTSALYVHVLCAWAEHSAVWGIQNKVLCGFPQRSLYVCKGFHCAQ